MFPAFKRFTHLMGSLHEFSTKYPQYPAGSLERVKGLKSLASQIAELELKMKKAIEEGRLCEADYYSTSAIRERTSPHDFSVLELNQAIKEYSEQESTVKSGNRIF